MKLEPLYSTGRGEVPMVKMQKTKKMATPILELYSMQSLGVRKLDCIRRECLSLLSMNVSCSFRSSAIQAAPVTAQRQGSTSDVRTRAMAVHCNETENQTKNAKFRKRSATHSVGPLRSRHIYSNECDCTTRHCCHMSPARKLP